MNLPELPKPLVTYYDDIDKEEVHCYSAGQLQAYAEEAVKQEREAILAAIDDIEERPWYGYENPNTFQDAKWAAMDVVRSRTAVPAKE